MSSDSPDIAPNDSIQALVQTARTDSVALTTSPGKDTVTAATAGAPVIRPVHPLSRLRVGIQGSVGFPLPREKGVSLMTGQGFRAEFALYKNIWLSASVDWLHFDVCTDKFVPRVHHSHHQPDTLHGSPDSKLVRVESTQRRQQIGLGLRYTLPLRTWLKPSVRAAYTWVHGSPETIRFEFKNP
ncbi:MAG: hypothetical protein IPJ82_02795 [Lewinellaceae bacterium]|nr:hypothetical protein [Lewinellaceae bacterium]